jgi:hypothetical protein
MDAQAVIEAVVEFLRPNPGGLLCDDPECYYCPWARQFLSERALAAGGTGS